MNYKGSRTDDGRIRDLLGRYIYKCAAAMSPPANLNIMVARFINKSRPMPHSRRSSSSSCAPVKRILGKQHRMAIVQHLRTPLSNKAAIVNRSSRTPPTNMPTPLPSATMTPPKTAHVRLPRTLPRPALREIDMSIIEEAFPDLAGLPAQYIRDKLAVVAPQ